MAVDSDSYGHDNPYSFTIHTHGNMAESSRMNQKRKDEEMDDEDGNEGSGGGSGTDNKRKHKFTRSRTACLQCRSRKSKCGALPPDPCPNCIETQITCEWPAEDGRSSRARMQRAKARLSVSSDTRPSDFGPASGSGPRIGERKAKAEVPAKARNAGSNGQRGGDEAWLDQLLNAGGLAENESDAYHHGNFAVAAHVPIPGASASSMYTSSLPSTTPGELSIPQQSPRFLSGMPSTPYPSSMDPAQFIWAVSSRLPTVEEASPFDQTSNHSNPSPSVNEPSAMAKRSRHKSEPEGKIVKVTWWRPHGQTAIAPGLKRITLKVRVDNPQDAWRNYSPRPAVQGPNDLPQEVISTDGAPSTPIMRHLLDVFMVHFGCQFPGLDRVALESKIESRTGSTFLLLSIAAIAARFSTHPAIALPDLQPYDYGNVFYARAKALLGSMLAVPSRDTATAFVLLASCGFANDSESEVWMMTGLAVRMSIDLGLHLDPPESSNISSENRRLNRLTFWSVLLMDYALAFGVGRSTTFRGEEITQPIPTQDDIDPKSETSAEIRSPFPFCAQTFLKYGPLINMLNMDDQSSSVEAQISMARSEAIKVYNQLPQDMQWNVGNLQRHSRANQAPGFLHLHLWMHTILASGYLTGSSLLRRVPGSNGPRTGGTKSGAATPNSATASNLWRNSARTIGDILVLSNIINPFAYCALPFVNQAFFVAGCCYVKEIEQTHSVGVSPIGSPRRVPNSLAMTSTSSRLEIPPFQSYHQTTHTNGKGKQVDLSRQLLTSVATNNISTLQQGLEKQNTYWQGTAWISSALKQRVEGMEEVDLVRVTEKLASSVSLPDAGLVGRVQPPEDGENGENGNQVGMKSAMVGLAQGQTPGGIDWLSGLTPAPMPNEGYNFGDLDLLSLPFDLGTMEGGSQNVTEQDVPLPQSFDPQWFR